MSVAATYAEALYEAAVGADALDEVASGVGGFAAAFDESAELRAALGNPEVDGTRKRAVVTALSEGAHPHVTNLLQVLVDRGRIMELPEIAAAFQDRVARAEGRLDVEAVTAIPLPADLRERIVASITEKTGRNVTLTESVDPEIVGGLVLKVGEAVVDGSVRSRIEELRRALTTTSVDSAAAPG
jgi:F-type H+-transporting ATPase subunit delta